MSALSTPITNQGILVPLYSKNGYNLVVDVVMRLVVRVKSCYNSFLLPLSNGEDAVVLALASYKCVEGVHPVRVQIGGKLCCP